MTVIYVDCSGPSCAEWERILRAYAEAGVSMAFRAEPPSGEGIISRWTLDTKRHRDERIFPADYCDGYLAGLRVGRRVLENEELYPDPGPVLEALRAAAAGATEFDVGRAAAYKACLSLCGRPGIRGRSSERTECPR